jgi:hypothetical protein
MKKILPLFLLILGITTSSFAWGHHGWHRGGVIIVPPPIVVYPRCQFVTEEIFFVNVNEANYWLNIHRYEIRNATISINQDGTAVIYYTVEYCS